MIDEAEDKQQPEQSSEALQALSTFCNRYGPANERTLSDFFTSKEIQTIVQQHTGAEISLMEIYQLMDQMHYTYKLVDEQFKWMVIKE